MEDTQTKERLLQGYPSQSVLAQKQMMSWAEQHLMMIGLKSVEDTKAPM